MKLCRKCDLEKPDESFLAKELQVDVPIDRWCADCRAKFADRRSARAKRLSVQAERIARRDAVNEELLTECVDCGRQNKDFLMFDVLAAPEIVSVSRRGLLNTTETAPVRCANCLVDRYRNIYKIPFYFISPR